MTGAKPVRGQPYHHGNLRAALIEAGLRLLETHAADELGLREVAREVGVSPTAIYQHFSNKTALMSALAAEGLSLLRAGLRDARSFSADPEAVSGAISIAYVRFAQQHPALFRLIRAYSGPTFLMTHDAGSGCTAALRAWSTAHGLAWLIVAGRVRADDTVLASVLASAAVDP